MATSGIGRAEFARRRATLMRMLGKDSLVVIFAAPTMLRTNDVDYSYRQNSSFAYFTGFYEPNAIAVLTPKRSNGEYVLFCLPHDKQREMWDGQRVGLHGAVRDFGADQAFAFDAFDQVFPQLAESYSQIYFPMDENEGVDQRLFNHLRQSDGSLRRTFLALEELTHEMRLRKSRSEIALMRQASSISAAAHRRAMRTCRPGLFEYQLAAELHYEFHQANAECAYPSIVGGGANACTLHYIRNSDVLKDGDLVLIDAGAEYQLYASDVTRTFPVRGCFKPAQRELYEIVLDAQYEAIKKVRPGNTWDDVHSAAVRVLTKGLVALGLLKGRVQSLIKKGEYRRFYMHRTGHWLGMDVHDVGNYREAEAWRRFEPGMALTVEPGLYIHGGADVMPRWRNTGIRIEDSVVVTKDGARVLSDGVPKEIDDIEALMSANR